MNVKLIKFFSGVILAVGFSSSAWALPPQLTMQPVKVAFIPSGFDSNDDLQLVVYGLLDDTCKKIAHIQFTELADGAGFQIIQWVRKFDSICLPVSTPFFTEVTIGRLPAGNYVVKVFGAPDYPVTIADATSSNNDDYLYAPVSHAAVLPSEGGYAATLTGNLPNDCFNWLDVKVIDQGGVIVLLPILEYVDNGHCSTEPVPFEKEVRLPSAIEIGYHLLHVRSMSGKAVNSTFFASGD